MLQFSFSCLVISRNNIEQSNRCCSSVTRFARDLVSDLPFTAAFPSPPLQISTFLAGPLKFVAFTSSVSTSLRTLFGKHTVHTYAPFTRDVLGRRVDEIPSSATFKRQSTERRKKCKRKTPTEIRQFSNFKLPWRKEMQIHSCPYLSLQRVQKKLTDPLGENIYEKVCRS